MNYALSSLLLFAGLGLSLVVLLLAVHAYWKGKKLGDLGIGAVTLLYLVKTLRDLFQQSSGIACSMVTGRGLLLHGLLCGILLAMAVLYLRDMGRSGERAPSMDEPEE